jgi:hypothetical protein
MMRIAVRKNDLAGMGFSGEQGECRWNVAYPGVALLA